MSTPAIEISIPSDEVAAQFTDGETAVASDSTGIQAVRYMAKWINLLGGIYTLKLWGADIVTAYIGMEGVSVRRIATAIDSMIEADFFTHPGQQRLDVSLNTVTSDRPYFVLSLWQGGKLVYASSANGWVYSTTGIADADVPSASDARLILPVWTVSPNWATSVMERLSWSTQILPSETDSEQRRSLRRHPRRSMEASFLRHGPQAQRIDTFLSGVGRKSFLVPLWFEQLRLPTAVNMPEEPPPLPAPYWEDTFTAANDTRPDARDIDIFPALDGYARWTYEINNLAGAIQNGELGQIDDVDQHWALYQLGLGTSEPVPESYVGTALLIEVSFANVRLPTTPEAREKVRIQWDVGYGFQTVLDIWEDGSSELSSGTGIITSSALSGTGTVRYVIHFSQGSSVYPVRYFVNGFNQGGEHHSAKAWTSPRYVLIEGIFERMRISRMATYADVNSALGYRIAGSAAALLPRPDYPTPPSSLVTVVRDTFTASDNTNPRSRLADVNPSSLYEGGAWQALAESPGVILSNRLYAETPGTLVLNSIEHNGRPFGDMIPCFPITLFLHGACGTPSLNTAGEDPYISVSWGYWTGTYFNLVLYRGNTYYASACNTEWMSVNYLNGTTPSAGAGPHKLALHFNGTNAYLIVDGAIVETSSDLSSFTPDPRSQVGFVVELSTKTGSTGTETYAEEVALYYGGTLSQAIALTA